MHKRKLFYLVSLALGFFLLACDKKSPTEQENLPIAPDFTLSDPDGNTYTLSKYRGQVVLLNFFATWCTPCLAEMPQLEANLWRVYRDQGLMVLGIDLREEIGKVKLFAVTYGITFPLAIDTSGSVFRIYAGGDQVTNVPYNVLVDKNQKIRYSKSGYNQAEMKSVVETLLKE